MHRKSFCTTKLLSKLVQTLTYYHEEINHPKHHFDATMPTTPKSRNKNR